MALSFDEAMRRCPLVAILRGIRPDEAVAVGEALVEAGFAIVEVPLNSPDPLASIRALVAALGERALVGAGTVRRTAEVTEIAAAGGRLVVSPHCDPVVIRAAKAAGMACVPGAFTPTEAFAALDAGADAVKLFPAEALPPVAVKALRAVLPAGTRLIPVGGIDAGTIPGYLAAGAAGFGLGSSLYKPGDGPAAVAAKALPLLAALRPRTG